MHAATGSESGWSSDEGGPPVDSSELPEQATLTFGQSLLEQGFAGDVSKQPSIAEKSQASVVSPKTPAKSSPGPSSQRQEVSVLLPFLFVSPS
jgi:hypothetical protein